MSDKIWRDLALQFDAHRMQAIQLLRQARESGLKNVDAIDEFLAAPPLSGETVLAQRLREIHRESTSGDKNAT